ncbi:hypothetical protein LX59_03071 [Azomonas agilis]|uniref:Uncharacterized protein n=1 Tax=Azomonas agilis TaxID=116849 RepID=A0A562HYH5_9GAMM|nr:hypothetical protein [Azomonas agilis]TWH63820.1 hypothetical protein LX59_03071 [Azomonas agilis]
MNYNNAIKDSLQTYTSTEELSALKEKIETHSSTPLLVDSPLVDDEVFIDTTSSLVDFDFDFDGSALTSVHSKENAIKSIFEKHKSDFENQFNEFRFRFEKHISFEEIPIDFESNIERELITLLNLNKIFTVNYISQWVIDSYDKDKSLINILKLLGNLDYDLLGSEITLVFAAVLSNKNTEIKEYALRVQEKWMDYHYHKILSQSELKPKWIDDYRKELLSIYKEINGIVK